MKVVVIVNPNSGPKIRRNKIKSLLQTKINSQNGDITIIETRKKGEGQSLAKKVAGEGAELVVAVGGDGTVNDVASGLVHTNIPMGVIPTGSGNGFARNFGIPLDEEEAVKLIFSGKPHLLKVDAGKINNEYFFNVAGFGFDAVIAREFEKYDFRGPLPYFWAGLKSFFQYVPPEIEIRINDEKETIHPFLLCFANGPQFGNNAFISPTADPQDGLLNMVTVPEISWLRALLYTPRLFNQTIDRVKYYRERLIQSCTLHASDPVIAHLDGEFMVFENKLKIESVKGALNVVSQFNGDKNETFG
ncbi:MAG: YegS/Rv2252/BmrU family lipid kinase [Calditrichia bacterium]